MSDAKNYLGIEGYGAETVGGIGGRIIHVTTLADSGTGSLRDALMADGPRLIVFDVAGQIDLKSQILVEHPNVTIAGQTAPGDGITISDDRIRIKTSEVVIQGVHFRPGDDPDGHNPSDRDGLMIGTTDFELKNIVIDHNSFTWATDENVSINGSVRSVTFSNNLVGEGLSKSINVEGEHSKGLLISNWDQMNGDANGFITVIKNLFAHNNDRNPEVRAGQEVEIINNYIYDSGRAERSIAVGGGSLGSLLTTVDIIGNVVDYGLSTTKINRGPITVTSMADGSAVYLYDNLLVDRVTDASGNQIQTSLVYDTGGAKFVTLLDSTSSGAVVLDSSQVRDYVLSNVGANPFDRDQTDTRIVNSVISGTGVLVNKTSEVATGTAFTPTIARDTDGDAIPDWYESLCGTDRNVFTAYSDFDHDGYYDIEEYFHDLIAGPGNNVIKSVGAIITSNVAQQLYRLSATGNTLMLLPQFTIAEGDKLEISGFLGNMRDAVREDYIDLAYAWGKTFISVDRDGLGSTYQLELIAEINGRVSEAELASSLSLFGETYNTDMNVVIGTVQADRIIGLSCADSITGLSGNDTLSGGAGGDILDGGVGNDALSGGADGDTLLGGAGTDKLDGGTEADVMRGGADNDTYIVDHLGDRVIETNQYNGSDDGGIDLVNSSVSFTLGAFVENLTLTGNACASGTGNDLANKITGNASANILIGLAGNDTLSGGAGGDMLDGGVGNDALSGGADGDTLLGGAGTDKLDGGTEADVMRGGADNDTYIVDHLGDRVIETNQYNGSDDGGIDLVNSSVSFTLGAFVENLTLTGNACASGTGNDLANKITGNASANILIGLAGNDTLSGGAGGDILDGGVGNDALSGGADGDTLLGGAGTDKLDGGTEADVMRGGADNDTYIVDHLGDRVIETNQYNGSDDGGIDLVNSSVSFTLGAFVENLTLTGNACASGTGNDLANKITGNASANILIGLAGNDTLSGGAGGDILDGGVGNDALSGGADGDTLLGGAGTDKLDGGTEADVMRGGADNDTYIVDHLGDRVIETNQYNGSDDGGIDLVNSSVSFTLGAFVENLTLTGNACASGTGNDLANKITGNASANILIGLAGNDILSGGAGTDTLRGGLGEDTLTGGAGVDQFIFDTAVSSFGSVDRITDFTANVDQILLEKSVFGALIADDARGHLSSNQFHIGTRAESADDRIIYDPTSGKLYYDVDGMGGADQLLFAVTNSKLSIGAHDFVII